MLNAEKGKEEKAPLTNMGYVRNAMRALEILEKTVNEMGGWIRPIVATKPSRYKTEDGVPVISVSLKLFFKPRLLCEYIEQHPPQAGDSEEA
jgi:hypothetical protein